MEIRNIVLYEIEYESIDNIIYKSWIYGKTLEEIKDYYEKIKNTYHDLIINAREINIEYIFKYKKEDIVYYGFDNYGLNYKKENYTDLEYTLYDNNFYEGKIYLKYYDHNKKELIIYGQDDFERIFILNVEILNTYKISENGIEKNMKRRG